MKDPMIPDVYTIRTKKKENLETFTIELTPRARTRQKNFKPGQFNMIYVPGCGEVAISISGAVSKSKAGFVHTIRAVGPVTRALQALPAKAQVGVRGPFGSSWPDQELKSKHIVFVAGGIGLAPLRPSILSLEALAKTRSKQALTTSIYYGARTPKDMIYSADLRRWSKMPGFNLETTVDHASRGYRGHVGVVTARMQSVRAPNETIALVCGPEIMIRFAAEKLISQGISAESVFVSTERNMKCAIGFCGHCQFGPHFICKDGPVFTYEKISALMRVREL